MDAVLASGGSLTSLVDVTLGLSPEATAAHVKTARRLAVQNAGAAAKDFAEVQRLQAASRFKCIDVRCCHGAPLTAVVRELERERESAAITDIAQAVAGPGRAVGRPCQLHGGFGASHLILRAAHACSQHYRRHKRRWVAQQVLTAAVLKRIACVRLVLNSTRAVAGSLSHAVVCRPRQPLSATIKLVGRAVCGRQRPGHVCNLLSAGQLRAAVFSALGRMHEGLLAFNVELT